MPTLVDASPTRNASSWEMPTLVDASPSRNASAQEMPASADAVFLIMLRRSEMTRQCRCFAHAKCFLLGNADTLRCFAFAKCFLAGNAGISRCCRNDNASQKRNVCNALYNKNKYLFFRKKRPARPPSLPPLTDLEGPIMTAGDQHESGIQPLFRSNP